MASVWAELKRRKVVQVAAVYAVMAWLTIQIIDVVAEPLNLPGWLDTVVIVLLGVGFPIAVILAWAFDATPEGVKATAEAQAGDVLAPVASQKLNYTILGFIALAVGFLVADRFLLAPAAPDGRSAAIQVADTPSRPVRRTSIDIGTTQSTETVQLTSAIALSPDGRRLAYTIPTDGGRQLYLRELDEMTARAVAGIEDAASPFFSPDGKWVGFFSDGDLMKVAFRGGPAQKLAGDTRPGTGGYWAPDDSILFTAAQSRGGWSIFRIAAAGGAPEPLDLDSGPGSLALSWPYVLPGENHMLFSRRTRGNNISNGEIRLHSFISGETLTLIEEAYNARYVPTGHIVFMRSAGLWAVPFDLDQMEITGPEILVQDTVQTVPTRGSSAYDFSADGLLVYLPGGETIGNQKELVWLDQEGQQEAVGADEHAFLQASISPDGRRIAFVATDSEANVDLWVHDLDRGVSSRLTFSENYDGIPVWTPDGQRLVYISAPGQTAAGQEEVKVGIYVRPADGSGKEALLLLGTYMPLSITPDGGQLILRDLGPTDQPTDLHVMSLEDGGGPRPLLQTGFSNRYATISPDGRWLAYTSNESGQNEVYVRPFPNVDDRKVQVSSNGGDTPNWGPQGGEIIYRIGDSLMVVNIEPGEEFVPGRPEALLTRIQLAPQLFDMAPNGKRFLFMRNTGETETSRITEHTSLVVVENWFEELRHLAPPDVP